MAVSKSQRKIVSDFLQEDNSGSVSLHPLPTLSFWFRSLNVCILNLIFLTYALLGEHLYFLLSMPATFSLEHTSPCLNLCVSSMFTFPFLCLAFGTKCLYNTVVSRQMVLMWLVGDTFKTVYFWLRSSPLQFFVCGCLQIFIDILVLGQCFIYRKKKSHLIN